MPCHAHGIIPASCCRHDVAQLQLPIQGYCIAWLHSGIHKTNFTRYTLTRVGRIDPDVQAFTMFRRRFQLFARGICCSALTTLKESAILWQEHWSPNVTIHNLQTTAAPSFLTLSPTTTCLCNGRGPQSFSGGAGGASMPLVAPTAASSSATALCSPPTAFSRLRTAGSAF